MSGCHAADMLSSTAAEQEWQGPAKCRLLPLSGKLHLESADAAQQTPASAKSCKTSRLTSSCSVMFILFP